MIVQKMDSLLRFGFLLSLLGSTGCGLLSGPSYDIKDDVGPDHFSAVGLEVVNRTKAYPTLSPARRVETVASGVLLEKGFDIVEYKEFEELMRWHEQNFQRTTKQADDDDGPAGLDVDGRVELLLRELSVSEIKGEGDKPSRYRTKVTLSAKMTDTRSRLEPWLVEPYTLESESDSEGVDLEVLDEAVEDVMETLPPRPFLWWLFP